MGLAVLMGEKSELYFLQNTDQRGRDWLCFRGPFTSNLCLFLSLFLLLCLLVPVFPPLFLFCPSFDLCCFVIICFFSFFSPSALLTCFICQASGSAQHQPHTNLYLHLSFSVSRSLGGCICLHVYAQVMRTDRNTGT